LSVSTRSMRWTPWVVNQAAARAQNAAAVLALVGKDLDVGQPGVVVDRDVQVAVAESGLRAGAVVGDRGAARVVACADHAAVDLVAAPIRDVAQLLDVDMHQLAGMVALVAVDGAA
jgi:hypothetical protein